jgi:hypothetical protein
MPARQSKKGSGKGHMSAVHHRALPRETRRLDALEGTLGGLNGRVNICVCMRQGGEAGLELRTHRCMCHTSTHSAAHAYSVHTIPHTRSLLAGVRTGAMQPLHRQPRCLLTVCNCPRFRMCMCVGLCISPGWVRGRPPPRAWHGGSERTS